MNRRWRHRLRRLRFVVGGLVAAGLVSVAVLIGLVQVLLPMAANYPDRVASILAGRLHQPVRFASMQGYWQPSGPLLVLQNVRIGNPRGTPLKLPSADVKIDVGALFRPGQQLVNLRLHGLHVDLQRKIDGSWGVAGFGSGGGSRQHLDLSQLPAGVWLYDLQMNINDVADHRSWRLLSDVLRLSNDGQTLRFAGTLRRPDVARGLDVAGRFPIDGEGGKLYVGGRDLDLGKLLAGLDVSGRGIDSGKGSLQLWLDWKHGRVDAVTSRYDLSGLSMHAAGAKVVLDHAKGLFGFARTGDGLRIRYAGATGAQAGVDLRGDGNRRVILARAKNLDLASVLPFVAEAPGVPAGMGAWLLAAQPHGIVRSARLDWSARNGLQSLDAGFDGLGFRPVDRWPGVDALDGRMIGDGEAVLLELPAQATTLSLPRTFRKPVHLDSIRGDIAAWRHDAAWHLGTDALDFSGKDFAGQARGEVEVPAAGGKPRMDMYLALRKTDVLAARQFLPIDAIPPKALAWLDRALIAGQLDHAEAFIHGDLADWPFGNHRGRFEARGEVTGLAMAYSPHWPRVEGVHAVASFVDDSMLVQADAGQAQGNQTRMAVASIPSFHDAELVLSVQGSGTGASMMDFARNSPIANTQARALRQLKLAGKCDFGFSLVLPFKDASAFTLVGTARLQGMDVGDPEWELSLRGLDGALRFDGRGLSGQGLAVQYNGVPSTLDLALGTGATGNPSRPVHIALHGDYHVATLVENRPALALLGKIASGAAHFDVGFDVDDVAGGTRQTLRVDSDLQGISLDLPSPLDKPADEALPMHLALQLPLSGADLQLSMGDRVQARARLPAASGAPLALAVMLGDTPPRNLPASGIRVDGHAARLDVSGWLQRAIDAGGGSGQGLKMDGVDVQIDRALLFGATLQPLHLVLNPQPAQILIKLDGPQIQGTLTLPTSEIQRRGIVAHLDRLYWPDDTGADNTATPGKGAPAVASSTPAVPHAVSETDAEVANTGINPAALPPLHVSVGDLRLGKAHLGESRFESWPTSKGMHIDQLRTHTRDVQIMASGDWQGDAQSSHTHMNIDFGAENLGSLLNALGFQGIFEGGRTHAHLDASWPGEPSSLALERMSGTLDIQVSKGRIPEVQPGMGRLLGLMAVTELPRRLALDFGDVFGKGFSFDSITGSFALDDGVARTNDLKLKGSAADVTITGSTDLRGKTYDQRVLVVPHLGNSLPVVGALAAGPVGAAAGLAVQGLLGKGLNKAASARYSMTGSWADPKITLVEKKGARPAARPAPASSSPPPPASAPHVVPARSSSAGPAVHPAQGSSAPQSSIPGGV